MPVIDVPDVGEVEFPDSMSESDIESALQKNYPAKQEILEAPPGSLKPSYFQPEQGLGPWTTPVTGAPNLVRNPKTIPEGVYNTLAKGLGSLISPLGLATAAVAPLKPAQPIIAGVLGGLGAKQAGQLAGELSVPQGRTPGQVAEQSGDILQSALMTLAPLAHVLPKATVEATKSIIEKGLQDASRKQEATEVHGDVREQPVEGQGEVPVKEGSQGVQPPQVGVQAEVPLNQAEEQARLAEELGQESTEQAETKEPTPTPEASIVPTVGEKSQVEGAAPISVGPGAASPGDVPVSREAAARIEQGPPEDKPLGGISTASVGINNAKTLLSNLWTSIKGAAGHSLPKTTQADRLVGEAGVRYASSKIAARPLAQSFAAHALEDTGVDPVKFGAALTEDNLQSIRETLRQQETELRAKGDEQGAQLAKEKGDNVATIIGSKGSPFKTQDEYFDFLEEPATKKALGQHIQLWKEVIEPQYKQAASLDPEIELPTRGQQTGARINLKAVLPDEEATKPVRGGVGAPSLTATFKRKSPFAIKAKGTGQVYDVNYHDIIANTFERQLEIANKNAFDDALIKSGNAVIDSPGQQITIKGEKGVPFPLTRRQYQNKNIYVRDRLADEYRTAANVDPKYRAKVITPLLNLLNKSALAGLTDFSVHTSNLMTALFNRPVSGPLFRDTLLSLTGRADVPVSLTKAVIKAFRNNQDQTAELAKIGAMRPEQKSGFTGRILKSIDKTTRLVLDDTFQQLAKDGLVENTETARREYVNQIGQYNRRLQGPITKFLRDTGLGPFVTAGKTFNALGVKMATLSPGAPATDAFAAASLRANVLSKLVGTAVIVGTLNYLFTKKITGREGTPLGDVDFGTDDKTGKHQSFPLASLLGVGRGFRVTGLKGAIQAKRLGLSDADAFDAAARDIVNSWVAPAAGPPVKAAVIAASGYPPAVHVGRASRVAPPGSSQTKENFYEAAIEANPILQSYMKYRQGKPMSEVLSSQLPRFTMSPGKTERTVKDYPKIVNMARANEFIEDVVYQARRIPMNERGKFLTEQMNRLPANIRPRAWNEFERRKLFTP